MDSEEFKDELDRLATIECFFELLENWIRVRHYSVEVAASIIKVNQKWIPMMLEGKARPNNDAIGKMIRSIVDDCTRELVSQSITFEKCPDFPPNQTEGKD